MPRVLSPLLVALLPCAALALDKQGSAHGGEVTGDATGFSVSGSVSLGVAPYNPSYAARPDNTGLALLRYAAHLDLDLIGQRLSIPVDLNFFTDRLRRGALKLVPTELDIVTGVTTTWPVGPGGIEAGVRVENDRPLDQGTFQQTYVDARVRYLQSFAALFPRLRDALGGGDVSGYLTLGWFAFNPTYAARPDNTGLALFRYAVHVELSTLREHLAFGLDATFFTDRQASAMRPSELDFTAAVIGRWQPWEVQIAYERDMPVDRPGFVQHFVYVLGTYSFEFGNAP